MWGPASYATPSSLSGTDTERRNREIPRTSRPWGRPQPGKATVTGRMIVAVGMPMMRWMTCVIEYLERHAIHTPPELNRDD